jgi:preprotein translocase subunit SecF
LVGLLYFGGPTLFPFVFAMIFGIVIGTYSSIYVASQVLLLRPDKSRTGDTGAEPDPKAQSAG